MTTPRPPRKAAQVRPAADPAVQAMFDQVHELEKTKEVTNPFLRPVQANPFVATGNPFLRAPQVSTAFQRAVAKVTTAFGGGGKRGGGGGGKVTSAFNPDGNPFSRRPSKGSRPLKVHRYVVPPPILTPPQGDLFWLPMCEFLDCFNDTSYYDDHLWKVGEGLNFNEAMESLGYKCVEDHRPEWESDREAFEETHGRPMSTEPAGEWDYCPDHFLSASRVPDIETMLERTDDHRWWEASLEWDVLLPMLVEMRRSALTDDPEALLAQLDGSVDWIYWTAGYELADVPEDGEQGILDAVKAGHWDDGLAAAYADEMVREYPELFGAIGKKAHDLKLEIQDHSHLQSGPEHFLVFDMLREPLDYEPHDEEHRFPRLRGHYCFNRVEYYSALARPWLITPGLFGWRLCHMVPVEAMRDD